MNIPAMWTYPVAEPKVIHHKERACAVIVRDDNGKILRDENGKARKMNVRVAAYDQVVR